MSGYDEASPEAHRPTEPGAAADDSHSGVDSWSVGSQSGPGAAVLKTVEALVGRALD